ncbi:MAG: 2-methylfumaryl-CoA isomerase [Candidatus Dormibacteraceae bacterium]
MSTTGPILAGLRVIELSAFVAAPLGGATLAGLGADVIRVDPPGGGIDIDRWPLHRGRSLYWAGLNQGKRSVTIDTRNEAGQRQVSRIIAAPGEGGGIVLTNLPVRGWNSYAELSKLRPDLIMVLITGDRDGGTAVDYTVNAAVGFPWLTGPEDHDGPINHVLPAWDGMTGYLAALAILAAERHRRLTGAGQLVELSLSDVAIAIAGHLGLIGEAILEHEPRGRFGNDVYGTFGRDFGTRDGRRVMVLALTTRQWISLGEATGLSREFAELESRLAADFRKEGERWAHRKQLCELLEPWIARRALADVRKAFDQHSVLWGPYQTVKQLVAEDPRASTANPMVADVSHAGVGRFLTTGSPLRFGAVAAVPPRPAPTLGEHTEEVLREFGLE